MRLKRGEKVLAKYQIRQLKGVLAGQWSVHNMSRQVRQTKYKNGVTRYRCSPQQCKYSIDRRISIDPYVLYSNTVDSPLISWKYFVELGAL